MTRQERYPKTKPVGFTRRAARSIPDRRRVLGDTPSTGDNAQQCGLSAARGAAPLGVADTLSTVGYVTRADRDRPAPRARATPEAPLADPPASAKPLSCRWGSARR